MKPNEDEIRRVAEQEIPRLEIKNMPNENELHVPITLNGYFYLVVFRRGGTAQNDQSWQFDSVIER